ncbi:MAG: T9SS type A sorting domain-containing protein [Bacteroidetes bacterium]|nr:T9SS type A sorting domain-containing protein [Bacteroidota bacterium]
MKRIFYSLILVLCIFILDFRFCQAQNQNNIWCFGDSSGIDFNQSPPVPFHTSLNTRGSCVSIADTIGSLLFYAETQMNANDRATNVYDRNNNQMPNGDNIIGEGCYSELLIIPFPGNSEKYYLFSLTIFSHPGLYYSIIDMSLNGGMGDVTQKNVPVNVNPIWDAMAAVKHANGRDWWLINKDHDFGGSLGNNLFYIYLITPDSIIHFQQSIGSINQTNIGGFCFSNSGDKLLFWSANGLLELFDFDRCNGVLSNYKLVSNIASPNYRYIGGAFSPNDNYFYASINFLPSEIYQYDINASNLFASRVSVASVDTPTYAGGLLRLAPDNKIYWSCAWNDSLHYNYPYPDSAFNPTNMNLSVINDPNQAGSACNFSYFNFSLGSGRTYYGLPNNPDYSLGPLAGSICDTLTSIACILYESQVKISPNPFRENVNIEQLDQSAEGHLYRIFDNMGRLVYSNRIKAEFETLNLSLLRSGLYTLFIDNHPLSYKLIKLN